MNTLQLFESAVRLQQLEQAFAWVTVLHAQAPASARPGDKAIVMADGSLQGWIGGGCAQPAVLKTARQALADGKPRTIRIAPGDETEERSLGDVLEFGMACHSGGTLELFIEPVLPAAILTIVGDSPVAQALSALAPRVGLQVILIAKGARQEDFPEARRVLNDDEQSSVLAALSHAPWVVVATQGRRDLQGLQAAISLKPQAIWFVASAKKAAVLKESLRTTGFDRDVVEAIIAPAGQIRGVRTPEEIALAVLADVVAKRRGQSIAPEEPRSAPMDAIKQISRAAAMPSASCCSSKPVAVEAGSSASKKSCCGD